MEETLTCSCGNQLWFVKRNGIECRTCEYRIVWATRMDFDEMQEDAEFVKEPADDQDTD